MSGRSTPAQHGPPDAATLREHLPEATLTERLYREHQQRDDTPDGGCWWFSSSGEGRFDLVDPTGTCYLGETEGVAARERCGRLMAMGVPITEAIYGGRVVSEVRSPDLDGPVGDLTDPAAIRVGVTGELSSTSNCAVCQEWARACWDAGFGGLQYAPRFTPGGRERAYAAFGDTGAQPSRGVVGTRTLLDVLIDLDYPTVRADELTAVVLQVDDDIEAAED